jgi:hypothetical protein
VIFIVSLHPVHLLFDHFDGHRPSIPFVNTLTGGMQWMSFITADGGGSNGYRNGCRLAALAVLFGLVVAFAHGCARLTGGRA